MESRENIIERLKQQGYSEIHEYKDPPHQDFPDHDHEGDELMVVLAGSMYIKMESKETILNSGDEFFFPAKIIHSAKVGSEGCESIVGEKT